MARITIRLPDDQVKKVDDRVKEDEAGSRSEYIRDAIDDKLTGKSTSPLNSLKHCIELLIEQGKHPEEVAGFAKSTAYSSYLEKQLK